MAEAVKLTETQALQAIKDKEGDFKKLYDRMKVDADFAKRKPYILTDERGKKIPNCDHVTLPKAAIFLNRANAITASSNQQIVVSGEGLKDVFTSKAEAFYRACFLLGDELLALRNKQPAFTFHSHMINERGRIGQRVIVEIDKDGKLKVEIIPWDFRFASYDFDKDGLAWASRWTTQSAASINATYEKTNIKGKKGKVRDFWSRTANYVWVDDKVVLSESNDNGEVPVALGISPAGLMFEDEEMEENIGESLLWLGRGLFDEANKVASILQTLNSGSLFPPLQKEYEEIPRQKPPTPQGGSRTVVPVKKGELYHSMPREDILQATRMSWSIIDSHLQQSSFSTTMLGTLQFPLSAVALEGLAEGQELVLLPSLQALSVMYLQTCNLIKRQFVKLNKTVELKGTGKDASYSASDIDGDYDVSFRYFTGSRKYALAGIAEARDIGDLVSDDYKRRELIKIENPDEEAKKLDSQQAEEMHPEIKVYRQLEGLVAEERWGEAWMARLKLRKILMAEYAPTEPSRKTDVQPQGGLPLFSGSPSRTGGPQARDITAEETAKAAQEVEVEG